MEFKLGVVEDTSVSAFINGCENATSQIHVINPIVTDV
jgi:hypothetical protein